MLSKRCDGCHRQSFSSGEWGTWICPYCGLDITDTKPEKTEKSGGHLSTAYDVRHNKPTCDESSA